MIGSRQHPDGPPLVVHDTPRTEVRMSLQLAEWSLEEITLLCRAIGLHFRPSIPGMPALAAMPSWPQAVWDHVQAGRTTPLVANSAWMRLIVDTEPYEHIVRDYCTPSGSPFGHELEESASFSTCWLRGVDASIAAFELTLDLERHTARLHAEVFAQLYDGSVPAFLNPLRFRQWLMCMMALWDCSNLVVEGFSSDVGRYLSDAAQPEVRNIALRFMALQARGLAKHRRKFGALSPEDGLEALFFRSALWRISQRTGEDEGDNRGMLFSEAALDAGYAAADGEPLMMSFGLGHYSRFLDENEG